MSVRGERTSERLCFGRRDVAARGCMVPFVRGRGPVATSSRVLRVNYKRKKGVGPFLSLNYRIANVSVGKNRVTVTGRVCDMRPGGEGLALVYRSVCGMARLRGGFSVVVVQSIVRRVPGRRLFLPFVGEFLDPRNVVFMTFPP